MEQDRFRKWNDFFWLVLIHSAIEIYMDSGNLANDFLGRFFDFILEKGLPQPWFSN
jgi:hypothetical protein